MNKKTLITRPWLIRAFLIACLVGVNIYWLWPKEENYAYDYRSFVLFPGAVCGCLVYRFVKEFLKTDDETEDLDLHKRKQLFAIAAGCLTSIPFLVLTFSNLSDLLGLIFTVIAMDIVALFFILTSGFDKNEREPDQTDQD